MTTGEAGLTRSNAAVRLAAQEDDVADAPVSIREVAALAGVSVGTVSNVLNRPDVVAWARMFHRRDRPRDRNTHPKQLP